MWVVFQRFISGMPPLLDCNDPLNHALEYLSMVGRRMRMVCA